MKEEERRREERGREEEKRGGEDKEQHITSDSSHMVSVVTPGLLGNDPRGDTKRRGKKLLFPLSEGPGRGGRHGGGGGGGGPLGSQKRVCGGGEDLGT